MAFNLLGKVQGLLIYPPQTVGTLFRVTSVGLAGQTRTVLETVYARVEEGGRVKFRRVLWRQLQ